MGLRKEQVIIGLTGPFGAGCSDVVAKEIMHGSMYSPIYSISDIVKRKRVNANIVEELLNQVNNGIKKEFGDGWEIDNDIDDNNGYDYKKLIEGDLHDKNNRIRFQNIGNLYRAKEGRDYFAKKIIEEIETNYSNLNSFLEELRVKKIKSKKEIEEEKENLMKILGELKLDKSFLNFINKILSKFIKEHNKNALRENLLNTGEIVFGIPIVIDSIRNVGEIEYLRRFSNFYLLAVSASKYTRWERVRDDYETNEKLFNCLEKRDYKEGVRVKHKTSNVTDKFTLPFGQQVSLCSDLADFCLNNEHDSLNEKDKHDSFKEKIDEFIELIKKPGSRPPNDDELMMSLAYSLKTKSRCLQRQVGAVITDKEKHQVLSSGYNDYPKDIETCEKKYGKCYRRMEKEKSPDSVHSRGLDKCRALHAEESAILQVAKLGGMSLKDAVLYTTTFPCTLCAKKIVEVGIKEVYYNEPYEHEPSLDVLKQGNVQLSKFEGVTAHSFSKLFEKNFF